MKLIRFGLRDRNSTITGVARIFTAGGGGRKGTEGEGGTRTQRYAVIWIGGLAYIGLIKRAVSGEDPFTENV